MMADDQVRSFTSRLGGRLGSDGETRHHPGRRLSRGAEEQTDIVPLRRQSERGPVF